MTNPTQKPSERILELRRSGKDRIGFIEAIIMYLDEQAAAANPEQAPQAEVVPACDTNAITYQCNAEYPAARGGVWSCVLDYGHTGGHSNVNGDWPAYPIIRAAEGVTLEPGEYEGLSLADWSKSGAPGDRFFIPPQQRLHTMKFAYQPAFNGPAYTAVRRVEPAPTPVGDSGSCPCNHASDQSLPHERCCPVAFDAALDAAGAFISAASDGGEYPNQVLSGVEFVRTAWRVRAGEVDELRSKVSDLESELKHERSGRRSGDQKIEELREQLSARDSEIARLTKQVETWKSDAQYFKAERYKSDKMVDGANAEIARLREELEAEQRACTQLHCDVSNAWNKFSFGEGSYSLPDLCTELDAISKSNPHAKQGAAVAPATGSEP